MENHKPTQNQRVFDYIKKNGSITQKQADTIAVRRLPSRIYDLRRMGYKIVSETVKVRNKYGEPCHVSRYRFAEEDL